MTVDSAAGLALLAQLHIAPQSTRKMVLEKIGGPKLLLSKLSPEDRLIGKYLLSGVGSSKTKREGNKLVRKVRETDRQLV